MWLLIDLVLVGVFAAIGRASHDEGLGLAGWGTTAWPFLAGVALGHLIVLAVRRAPGTLASGGLVWLTTLAGGMLLRRVSDQGTAAPFVIVATLVLAAFILIPRLLLSLRRPAPDREVTGGRGPA